MIWMLLITQKGWDCVCWTVESKTLYNSVQKFTISNGNSRRIAFKNRIVELKPNRFGMNKYDSAHLMAGDLFLYFARYFLIFGLSLLDSLVGLCSSVYRALSYRKFFSRNMWKKLLYSVVIIIRKHFLVHDLTLTFICQCWTHLTVSLSRF